ncbi:MAG: nuclear receptor-binding factor 2 [Bacteroidaceae bacterium]|nr:nuclear receptor-binding factor 2 [Bacteroidaceae bacterium]
MRKAISSFILTACLMVACSQDCSFYNGKEFVSGQYRMTWEEVHDSLSLFRLYVDGEQVDSLTLPYPVYRFDYGDLTGDSIPEVLIGVFKPTKYWKEPAKRLFIYHLYHGRYIRPLWLGSRVGSPLVDFSVCRDSFPAVVHTTEMHHDSTLFHSEYRLQGFGLKFVKYLGN